MTTNTIHDTGFGAADDELGRGARAIFDARIVATLTPGDVGKYLVIDTQTGEWELDDNDYQASLKAYRKNPGARTWYGVRIGYRAVYNIWGTSTDASENSTS